MATQFLLIGALFAAPLLAQNALADPVLRDSGIVWFSLTETRSEVLKRLGPPASIADFGEDYQSWQYHLGNADHHDFSHHFVFRRSCDKLLSVTRSYEHEHNVDKLFPEADSAVYFIDGSTYGARVRALANGRLLIAMGSTKPGRLTSQLMLIASAELPRFHRWLHEQISLGAKTKLARKNATD